MNRWTNAGGSIDWHLPIAWRAPYKRVYPRLKVGDATDASFPMHGEGCMPQAAALRISLRVLARNEWTEWMLAPLLSEAKSELVYGISWGTLQSLRSLWPRTVQMIVSVWHPTRSASSPSGAFPGPREGEAGVNLALPRWCVMRDQEPAPRDLDQVVRIEHRC